MTEFRFFGLDDLAKELIRKACADAPWVELAPLDKGLSGSAVLMARWTVSNASSKFHVFKIGDPRKLQREHDAINNVAAPLVHNFPHASIYVSNDGTRALLSQEFLGEGDGSTRSLRQYIERAESTDEVVSIIQRLYNERLIDWRPKAEPEKPRESASVREALGSWIRKGELARAGREIGESALQSLLVSEYGLDTGKLAGLVNRIFDSHIAVDAGPVHGDLHSQNVLVGRDLRISLIDFGWTAVRWRAVDYLWLECSLKFVVTSPYADVSDLLRVEEMLDEAWQNGGHLNIGELDGRMLSHDLKKLACGAATIRHLAREHLPDLTLSDYRKGLIATSYALTTFPELNLVYLMHSLARNARALEPELVNEGPYHGLYGVRDLLWPGRPGRMVRRAVEVFGAPAQALDVGCGDGKNLVFLEDCGWRVTGIDISSRAISAAARRQREFFGPSVSMKSELLHADAITYDYEPSCYELAIAYGLYHCLDDEGLIRVHAGIVDSLKPGGLFAFAAFNDALPLPIDHGTGEIFLRPERHIFDLVAGDLELLYHEVGEICEDHLPLVPEHRHSLTWALFRKPRQ